MSERRTWRKIAKKMQRKKRRQTAARERDVEEEAKEADPEYQDWLRNVAEQEKLIQLEEERRQTAEEEAWLRREALAQHQFGLERVKMEKEQVAEEALRLQQIETQKESQRQSQRLAEQVAAEFENTMEMMQRFLDDTTNKMTPPKELRRMFESRPDQKLCEFYERTNCCRFDISCTRNHRRPMLAKIVLIRHFFVHPLLDQMRHTEYSGADESLELSENDLSDDYYEFFKDATTELEKFGIIKNFRTVRNILPHLRGHVFVEFENERSALKAFISLQGRYYASKRLNIEFSNIQTWRGAVCGLSLKRKCEKGFSCGYLHLFKNPNNKYNTSLEYLNTPKTSVRQVTPANSIISWNDVDLPNSRTGGRNWRWSESPELDSERISNNARTDCNIVKAKDYAKCSEKHDKSVERSRRRDRSSERKKRKFSQTEVFTETKGNRSRLERRQHRTERRSSKKARESSDQKHKNERSC